MSELLGAISGTLAIIGVVMNNYKLRHCFILWLISNAVNASIHAHMGLWSLAVRDWAFFLLAYHGWRQWR